MGLATTYFLVTLTDAITASTIGLCKALPCNKELSDKELLVYSNAMDTPGCSAQGYLNSDKGARQFRNGMQQFKRFI